MKPQKMRCGIVFHLMLVHISVAYAEESARIPPWAHNHLLDAQVSSNLDSYNMGLRGKPNDIVFDFKKGDFQHATRWNEFGVRVGADIGVIPESDPAWWMAEWKAPVGSDLISLSGCYPNQPQPETAWKIELRQGDSWREHARGVGGWYDNGRYLWRASAGETIRFDAIRISIFSKDDHTPLKSIHFRGEKNMSWVVAGLPDIDACPNVSRRRIRLGDTLNFEATHTQGRIKSWNWDFGDDEKATGKKATHTYAKPGEYRIVLDFASDKQRAQITTTVAVDPPIEARITPLLKPVRVGEPVIFDANDSQGKITQFVWALNDNTSDSTKRIEHTFSSPGIYEVRLHVSGEGYFVRHGGTRITCQTHLVPPFSCAHHPPRQDKGAGFEIEPAQAG